MSQVGKHLHLKLCAGTADQYSIWLKHGHQVEPFSVGTSGAWRIFAPGVADTHAYIHFDGETASIASADPDMPLFVGGLPVGSSWVPLIAPCEIALGDARLQLTVQRAQPSRPSRSPSRNSPTILSAPPTASESSTRVHHVYNPLDPACVRGHIPVCSEPAPDCQRTHAPARCEAGVYNLFDLEDERNDGCMDSELTRVHPIELAHLTIEQQTKAPLDPSISDSFRCSDAPHVLEAAAASITTSEGPTGATTAPSLYVSNVADATQRSSARTVVAAWVRIFDDVWENGSWVRKMAIALVPATLLSILIVFFGSPVRPMPFVASTNASVAQSPAKRPSVSSADLGSHHALASASASVDTRPVDKTLSLSPAELPVASPSRSPARRGPASASLERMAADAVVAGAHDDAIRLYERLAAERPNQVVFHQAVRILRAKRASARQN